ncbi:MAG: TIR domain-containing protein [Candidatus Heimdallarchaeota archaeon]|nr:TIR domain-containing protein [Candidatus Heimdallarchaeota archaeon]
MTEKLTKEEEKKIEKRIEELKDEERWEVRRDAAWTLGKMGEKAAEHEGVIEALIEALKDEDWWVRERAAIALGEMGEKAVPALIESLKDEERGEVRRRAAFALGEIGEKAIAALIEVMKDEERAVRYWAAWALGKIGKKAAEHEGVIEALIEALKDEDWEVRERAAYALGLMKKEEAVPKLLELLDDPEHIVRIRAIKILSEFADEGLVENEAIDDLVRVMEKDEEMTEIRQRAVQVLIKLGKEMDYPTKMSELLREELKKYSSAPLWRGTGLRVIGYDRPYQLKPKKLEGIGFLLEDDAISILRQLLDDEEKTIRERVVMLLEIYYAKEERGHELLERVKEYDDSKTVQAFAAFALLVGSMAHQLGEDTIAILQQETTELTLEALKREENSHSKFDLLDNLIRVEYSKRLEEDTELIEKALGIMSQMSSSGELDAEEEDIFEEHQQLFVEEKREKEEERLEEKRRIKKRIEELKDEDWWVREGAAIALGEIGEKAAEHEGVIEALIEAMKTDSSRNVRLQAISALGVIGSKQAVRGLMEKRGKEIDGETKERLQIALWESYKKDYSEKYETFDAFLETFSVRSVFISYSWDSKEHKEWVKKLGEQLIQENFDVFLDEFKVELGEYFTSFMNNIEECDYTLMIFTEKYNQKLKEKVGGVEYERKIIDGLILKGIEDRRIIPILREKAVRSNMSTLYSTKRHLDLSNEEVFEKSLKRLINHIKKEKYV